MCICDNKNVGSAVPLKSSDGEFHGGSRRMFLDLEILRSDKWSAEITATATAEEDRKYSTLVLHAKINYCPKCGRRLSLEDAGREDTWTH